MSSLMGYLMRNGLVNNADDMDAISSPYLTATARQTNLMQLLSANGGGNGHFLFYMSLCESLESNPLGHGDAVDELKRRGELNNSLIKGVIEVCTVPPLLVSYLGGLILFIYQAKLFSLLCIAKKKARESSQEYTCVQIIITTRACARDKIIGLSVCHSCRYPQKSGIFRDLQIQVSCE